MSQNSNLNTNVANLTTNKVNTSDVVNNLTTTESGKVLDARQGKALDGKITPLQGYGQTQVYTANTVLDDYKDTGIWMVWIDEQVSSGYHFPPLASQAGMLVVTSSYHPNYGYRYIQQEYIERNSNSRHIRTWDNTTNTWTRWFVNSYNDTKKAITTTDTAISMNSSSYWMTRNGFCFCQLSCEIADTSQHSIDIGLPKSSFGNYLYYRNDVGECRIDANGNVRLKSFAANTTLVFVITYPCSE